MIKQQIIEALKGAMGELGIKDVEPMVEVPNELSHGDWSSNLALVLAKKAHKSPMELAEQIKEKLAAKGEPRQRREVGSGKLEVVERIETAPPGFINFWLSKDYLIGQLASQVFDPEAQTRRGETLEVKRGRGRVMVEFTDPNPFKEFHIGHLYSNIVGESLCRLLEANGAQVMRANYQGDVGMHVAKAIYGLLREFKIQNSKFKIKKKPLQEKVKLLGEAYALGAKAYEEDKEAKKEINELNKKIYQQDPAVMDIYNKGKQWSLDYFESIYQRLGTKFDFYYFESRVGKIGLELVKQYVKKPFGKAQGKGVFEESEGAIIFPGKQFGLHTRVFINSLGLPTYEAKELGLAPTKYEEFPYDQSLIVTGNEIIEYFKVLLLALAKIRPDLAAKTKHIAHGMVRLAQGKMSSRTGNIITGEWLLDEAKAKIKKQFSEMDEETAEMVAVGAVKYALLKSGIGKDIAFSFEESINLEGNSGPYLQYTYARTQSVLGKSNGNVILSGTKDLWDSSAAPQNDNIKEEEVTLLRLLHSFPEIVSEAAEKFAPNLVCNYLFNLAQSFNLFYQKHKILPNVIPSEGMHQTVRPEVEGSLTTQTLLNKIPPRAALSRNDNVYLFRLSLTAAAGQTLKKGLYLLGIATPARM